ncbi:MAG TPA: hypothetical protein VN175_11750 [Rhizomicrobium sp.]|nr:hypothetical protein [Rhizomicrobium sp.]
MKHAVRSVFLAVLLAVSTPALAGTNSICVDASSRNQYNARPISLHDVLARNAIGPDRRAARLTTTCIHIYRDSFVALHSLTRCIDKGDEVAVSTIDGRRERCMITAVAPVAESYADAKYN